MSDEVPLNQSQKSHLSPAVLDALKILSTANSSQGIEQIFNCDKLAASLELLRSRRNLRLFEKLDEVRKDFSGLNQKLNEMEESIEGLRQTTSELVKSLPEDESTAAMER